MGWMVQQQQNEHSTEGLAQQAEGRDHIMYPQQVEAPSNFASSLSDNEMPTCGGDGSDPVTYRTDPEMSGQKLLFPHEAAKYG
jgi:hypothetical protein